MNDRSVDVAVAEDASVSNALGSLLETKFVEAPITFVPLSRLSVSPLNMRRKALTGIDGLADSNRKDAVMRRIGIDHLVSAILSSFAYHFLAEQS